MKCADRKVVLITGGAGGIGSAITEKFANHGYRVAIVGRNLEKGTALETRLLEKDLDVKFYQHDVTNALGLERVLSDIEERWEPVSVLVDCAGAMVAKSILEITREDFEMAAHVNLYGPLVMAQAVAPKMIERGFGRIINITSILDETVFKERGIYGATKAGTKYLTKVMAMEWGNQGITTNVVAPGTINTPMSAHARNHPETREKWLSMTANGKFGEATDIAEAVFFLASEEAKHINGAYLRVDGGCF